MAIAWGKCPVCKTMLNPTTGGNAPDHKKGGECSSVGPDRCEGSGKLLVDGYWGDSRGFAFPDQSRFSRL